MPKKIKLREDAYEVLPNGVYDIKDAAKYFGCSTKTIGRMIDKGIIKAAKPLGIIKFKGEWLLEVMNNKDILIGKELEE